MKFKLEAIIKPKPFGSKDGFNKQSKAPKGNRCVCRCGKCKPNA